MACPIHKGADIYKIGAGIWVLRCGICDWTTLQTLEQGEAVTKGKRTIRESLYRTVTLHHEGDQPLLPLTPAGFTSDDT